jgi:spore coat protein U-like protein
LALGCPDENKKENKNTLEGRITMSKNIFLGLVVGLVALFAISGTATAATDTANLQINASVNAVGRITAVGDINFGTYDPTDPAPLDQNGSVSYRVAKGVDYWVYISETSAGVREMSGSGVDVLDFDLYKDSVGGTEWGIDAATGISGTSAGNGTVTNTIFGRVPALQDVAVDAYAETLVITLEF